MIVRQLWRGATFLALLAGLLAAGAAARAEPARAKSAESGLTILGSAYPVFGTGRATAASAAADPVTHGFLLRNGRLIAVDFPGAVRTYAAGVNNSGDVAGSYELTPDPLARSGFLLHQGSYTSFQAPGAVGTYPLDINDRGHVAGSYLDAAQVSHGFLRTGKGFTVIDVPGAAQTFVWSVNNNGLIVGSYVDAAGAQRGFAWDDRGVRTVDFPGAQASTVLEADDEGRLAGAYLDSLGSHGYLLDRGVFTTIDATGPTSSTAPYGLNNRRQVVGVYLDVNRVPHGFLLERGAYTYIDIPGSADTQLFDINDRGVIAGSYADPADPA